MHWQSAPAACFSTLAESDLDTMFLEAWGKTPQSLLLLVLCSKSQRTRMAVKDKHLRYYFLLE